MPTIGRAEPPTDIFLDPTDKDHLSSWLREFIRALLGAGREDDMYDFISLRDIGQFTTEYDSTLIEVDTVGVNSYADSNGEDMADVDDLSQYMSFLLVELDPSRTELWARYRSDITNHDYPRVVDAIEARWPGSKHESRYELDWPSPSEAQEVGPGSSVYQFTPEAEARKKRPAGRPRAEADEWAREQVWVHKKTADQVFVVWLRMIEPDRLVNLADPRDSFFKLLRIPPKPVDSVENSEKKDDIA